MSTLTYRPAQNVPVRQARHSSNKIVSHRPPPRDCHSASPAGPDARSSQSSTMISLTERRIHPIQDIDRGIDRAPAPGTASLRLSRSCICQIHRTRSSEHAVMEVKRWVVRGGIKVPEPHHQISWDLVHSWSCIVRQSTTKGLAPGAHSLNQGHLLWCSGRQLAQGLSPWLVVRVLRKQTAMTKDIRSRLMRLNPSEPGIPPSQTRRRLSYSTYYPR